MDLRKCKAGDILQTRSHRAAVYMRNMNLPGYCHVALVVGEERESYFSHDGLWSMRSPGSVALDILDYGLNQELPL